MAVEPRFRARLPPHRRPPHRSTATGRRQRGPYRLSVALAAVLLMGLLSILVSLRTILFPFVVAAIIAYVLEPPVGRVARRGLPRWVSVLVVYATFGVSLWGFSYYLFPKLAHEGEKGVHRIQQLLREAPSLYEDVRNRVGAWLNPGASNDFGEEPEGEWATVAEPMASRVGLGPNLGVAPTLSPMPEVPALPQVHLSAGTDDLSAAEVLGAARGESPLGGELSLQERIEAEQDASLIVEELGKGRLGVRLNETTLEIKENHGGFIQITPRPPQPEASPLSGLQEQLTSAIIGGIETAGTRIFETVIRVVQSILQGLVGAVIGLVLVFMVAAFILMGADRMRAYFRSLVPPKWEADYDELLAKLDIGLSGVVRGQLFICLVNGILSGIGFWIFIPEYAVVLAIFAGFMSLVPIFGTIISSVPAVLIGLTTGMGTAFAVLLWILGIHFVEANFLNPKIIGTAAHIHPVIVVFVLIAGEHVYGLPGVILSVPAVAILQVLYAFTYKRIRPYLWGERS